MQIPGIRTADTHIKSHRQWVHRWVHAQCQLINTRTEKRGTKKKCSDSTTHKSWSKPAPILNAGQEQQWDVSCTYGMLPTAFSVTMEWHVVTAYVPLLIYKTQQLNSLPTTPVSTTIIKVVPTPHSRPQRKTKTVLEGKAVWGEPCLPWADLISNVCQVIQLCNLFRRVSFAMGLHCSQDLLQASFRSFH